LARLAYTAVSKTKTRRSSVFAVSPHRYLLRRRSLSPATIWPALPQIPPSCLRSRQSTVPPLLWPESPPTSHPRPAACRRAALLWFQLLEDLELLAAPPPPAQLQPKNDLTRGEGAGRPAATKVGGGRRRLRDGCSRASARRMLQDGSGGVCATDAPGRPRDGCSRTASEVSSGRLHDGCGNLLGSADICTSGRRNLLGPHLACAADAGNSGSSMDKSTFIRTDTYMYSLPTRADQANGRGREKAPWRTDKID
jgi:hypothetical protein